MSVACSKLRKVSDIRIAEPVRSTSVAVSAG
jgi:hypothetical protein